MMDQEEHPSSLSEVSDVKTRVLCDRKFEKVEVCYDPLLAGSIDGTDTIPHDNAVVRAINADYHPRKFDGRNPLATLFVWKLHPKVTEDYIREKFSQFGEISMCTVIRDIVTGTSKGYAFVEYSSEDDAYSAFIEGRNIILSGQKANVDYERGRTLPGWKPRRLGGGFGGRKESGQLRFGGRMCPIAEPIIIGRKKPYSRERDRRRR